MTVLESERIGGVVRVPEVSAFDTIEARIDAIAGDGERAPMAAVAELLQLGEDVLVLWVAARGLVPTDDRKEGFRLLALHRQGAKGEPSFNACRETCRELVYYHNCVAMEPGHPESGKRVKLAAMVARHLCLFVGGKMQVEGLGDFCCSSKSLRGDGK